MNGQDPLANQGFVRVGTVLRPHGIKGELKVRPFTAQPADFGHYARLFLAPDDDAPKDEYIRIQSRASGNLVILRLKECNSRERAEQLAGFRIWLRVDDLPALAEGEFYLYTLLGRDVRTAGGQFLGRAEDLMTGSGQDILVVRQGNREFLIPIVRAFIVSIETAAVILDLPEGLLEMND